MDRDARTVFVGRAAELERLNWIFGLVSEGTGHIVALAGEPGIGKTSTAMEFANSVREREIEVIWGRCAEVSGAPAYWPWIQIIREYLGTH